MVLKNLGRLWRVLRRDPISGADIRVFRPIAFRALGWLIATELLVLFEVYPLRMLVDGLSAHNKFAFGLSQGNYMVLICLAVFALYEATAFVSMHMEVVRNNAGWLYYVIINDFGNRKQLSLGSDWHTANSSGKKESTLSKNHKKVDYMFDNLMFDIGPLTMSLPPIALGQFLIGWQFGVLAIVTVTIYLLLMAWNERRFMPMREDFRAATKLIEQSDSELNSTAMDIRRHGLEHDMTNAHRELLFNHWRNEVVRHRKFRFWLWLQNQSLIFSRVAFYGLSYVSYRHGVSIGSIVLANAWMERIYKNIWRYGQFQYVLNEGSEALRELVELFETEPTIKIPETPQWPTEVQGRIELKDMTFQYEGALRPALADINLIIEPGTTVALVGTSGGGKSTLARLIQHQYDPTQGEILVDGVNLRDIDDLQYRRVMLGSVPQEPGLFDRTVERNIGMVRPGASKELIRRAAKEASADEFIEQLPKGYDTMVGERGIVLSGGQRQRVAIARALLRRPPILVLDEPTSALDAESQLWIKQTLEKLSASRESTILIIAHRFSTIEMADVVVVLENGRITEIGTDEQLRRRNGLYQHLLQLEGLLD